MDGHRWFGYTALVALALCWVTIILGGNVIASDSGLGCSTWPSCNGTFFPPIAGAMGIEWVHRVSAFFLALSIAILTVLALAYERGRPALLRLTLGALVLVVVLALLGGAVVDSNLNIGLVLLHFGIATILFGILLILALLSNWRHLPERWLLWARRATEPRAAAPSPEPRAAIDPRPRSYGSDASSAGRS